jgi:hypothetical protein
VPRGSRVKWQDSHDERTVRFRLHSSFSFLFCSVLSLLACCLLLLLSVTGRLLGGVSDLTAQQRGRHRRREAGRGGRDKGRMEAKGTCSGSPWQRHCLLCTTGFGRA